MNTSEIEKSDLIPEVPINKRTEITKAFILHQLAVYHSNLSHDPHLSPKEFLQYWTNQTLKFLTSSSSEAKITSPEDCEQLIQLFPVGENHVN